jgi:hypothetical protein
MTETRFLCPIAETFALLVCWCAAVEPEIGSRYEGRAEPCPGGFKVTGPYWPDCTL